jgi:hypothetical protein
MVRLHSVMQAWMKSIEGHCCGRAVMEGAGIVMMHVWLGVLD